MIMFNRDKTFSGWCCVDCLFWLANGDEPSRDYNTGAEIAEWRESFERGTQGCEVTLGMFREGHECRANWTVTWHAPGSVRGSFRRGQIEVLADSFGDAMDEVRWAAGAHWSTVPAKAWPVMARSHELETEADRGGECECEQQSFSWSACDTCGSSLGGHRHAVTFWIQPEPAPAHTDEADIARMEADGAGLYAAGV
jgi:hypothetical protein